MKKPILDYDVGIKYKLGKRKKKKSNNKKKFNGCPAAAFLLAGKIIKI